MAPRCTALVDLRTQHHPVDFAVLRPQQHAQEMSLLQGDGALKQISFTLESCARARM